jgi:hypothetical protein
VSRSAGLLSRLRSRRVGLAPPSVSLSLVSRTQEREIKDPCHLERVSPRTSRKVPTGPEARCSRRRASFLRGTLRLTRRHSFAQGDLV